MEPDDSVAIADARAISPYVGLSYYTEADAEWFFGREDESQTIIANLRAARLTILYAQSGVGKSSLLRAGVARELGELARRQLAQRGSVRYVPVVFGGWRDHPVDDLIDAIEDALVPYVPQKLPRDHLDAALEAATAAVDARILIILDQFEEYLLYRSREAAERSFADELARCVNRPELHANFVIAIREDAYAGLGDVFAGKVANIYGNYLQLEYLDRDAARGTIIKPIEHFNAMHPGEAPIEIEPALVEAVLDQVRTGEVVVGQGGDSGQGSVQSGNGAPGGREEIETPYLQLVMTTLWNRERERGSGVLRVATFEELGGAQEIVRTHLDGALTALPDDARDTALDLFRFLVTPSGTKIVYAASDLAQMTERPQAEVATLLAKLAQGDTRIVRHVPPPAGRAAPDDRYEIFHDVLAPAIIDWRRRALEQRKSLADARERERLEREKHDAEEQARRERRRARMFGALTVGLLVVVAIAIIAVVFAEHETSRANVEQRSAESRQLAAQALGRYADEPDSAALLSLEAYRPAATPDARSAIVTALEKDQPTLAGASADIDSLAVSHDASLIAGGDGGGDITIWSTRTHAVVGVPIDAAPSTTSSTDAPIEGVAFSPNGQMLASGGADNTVRLWSVATRREIGAPLPFGDEVSSVAFSPNGKILAAGSWDDTVRLYSVASLKELGRPLLTPNWVTSVAFSTDGKTIAAGDYDNNVYLWSTATHRSLGQLTGHTNEVTSVAFSPDGTTLAAGSADDTILLWSLATHRLIGQPFVGHTNWVDSVAFSPDGATLASGSSDGSVRVWSVKTHTITGVWLNGAANAVVFTPDGQSLAASSGDDVNQWNLHSGPRLVRPVSPQSDGTAIAVSPSGRELATTGASGHAIELWNLQTGAEIGSPTPALGSTIVALAFSPDGRTVASDSNDHTIRLWSLATDRQLGPSFSGLTNPSEHMAFSPDGALIAAGAPGNVIRFWSTATHRPEGARLTGDTSQIDDVAFSPDGRELASASNDGTLRLWDVSTRKQIGAPFRGHQSGVDSVAFSPDGQTLVSGGRDSTVRLWSVASHRELGPPLPTGEQVANVGISPDGGTVFDVTIVGTLQLWDTQSGEQLGPSWDYQLGRLVDIPKVALAAGGRIVTADGALNSVGVLVWTPLLLDTRLNQFTSALCPILPSNLSRTEWSQLLPGEPYHETCAGKPS